MSIDDDDDGRPSRLVIWIALAFTVLLGLLAVAGVTLLN